MAKRVAFSEEHLELCDIADYYSDSEQSFKEYFLSSSGSGKFLEERFTGYSVEDLERDFKSRIDELNHLCSLSLLSALEAAFRIDYLQRNYRRKKDPLSKELRVLYSQKNTKASLEDEILDAWKRNTHGASRLISDLKGVFKYRHWLAHGRYWEPKMGRKFYDYASVYELVETVISSFPFEGVNE